MKKVLFLAASVLGSALLLTGCDKKPGTEPTSEVTGITVTPATYDFTLGDDPLRLSYTLAPAGAEATLEWTSSNEEVATVDGVGKVTALNLGEATITATVKGTDIKGACKITVKSLEENLRFSEAYIGIMDYDSVNTIVYEHSTFGKLNVHVCEGRVQLFTDGLYFNASGKLDGVKRGGWIYISTPIALAYADENKDNPKMADYKNGVSFSLGGYYVDLEKADTVETKWHHAHKGYSDDEVFISYLSKWLDSYNQAGEFTQENYQDFAYAGIYGFGGTELTLKEYATDEETGESSYEAYPNWLWSYTPNGIVTSGELYIGGEKGSSEYMYKIDYLNAHVKFVTTNEIGIPGAYLTKADENSPYVLTSKGVEFGAEVDYLTGEKPAQAPAGISIFVDHILPRVSDNEMDGKAIALPNNKLTIK